MREISRATRESFVIQGLLQNPKIDYAPLGRIEEALPGSERPGERYSIARLQELNPDGVIIFRHALIKGQPFSAPRALNPKLTAHATPLILN